MIAKCRMTFKYSNATQGSDEWLALRVGKPSASRLKDLLAVSKRTGEPLLACKQYEYELALEAQYQKPFARFVTGAMREGQEMEEFVRHQYERTTKTKVRTVGCYYNDVFVASPDGEIGADGLIEIKWVYDKRFSEVLMDEEVPEEHVLQMQGQMWAADRLWCDYVIGNANMESYKIIRVKRDEDIISRIEKGVEGFKPLTISQDGVYQFTEELPELNLDKEF